MNLVSLATVCRDSHLRTIELAHVASCFDGKNDGAWEGLVAARKYRIAELTGQRDGWRRFGGKYATDAAKVAFEATLRAAVVAR